MLPDGWQVDLHFGAGAAVWSSSAAGSRSLPHAPGRPICWGSRWRRPGTRNRAYSRSIWTHGGRAGSGRAARQLWTYGGTFSGRLIRAREGETLRIHFANRLPETKLHFHRVHIPPTGRADNIWLRLPPGERFTYELTVPYGKVGTYR